MLTDSERLKLLSTYTTPKFQYGDIVHDERFGEVEIVGLTDSLIPWPIGRRTEKEHRRQRAIVLYDCLVDAVRNESNQAVAHWWGVTGQTVTSWRNALGCDRTTDGTRRLRRLEYANGVGAAMAEKLPESLRRPERRLKISLAKKGKPRPPEVIEAMRRANLGKKLSAETRRKLSVAHRHRGTRPPKAGRAWTAEEDQLCRTLPPAEVTERTGRTMAAVLIRRQRLGITKPGPQKFSPADDALIAKLPPALAAEKLGRPVSAIYNRRSWLGITKRAADASN